MCLRRRYWHSGVWVELRSIKHHGRSYPYSKYILTQPERLLRRMRSTHAPPDPEVCADPPCVSGHPGASNQRNVVRIPDIRDETSTASSTDPAWNGDSFEPRP